MLKQTIRKLSLGLLLSYFVSAILSALLILTIGSATANGVVSGIVSVVCILIYLALIHNTTWSEGFKDPNRVQYGHMDKFMLKGLVAGLFADIPCVAAYLFALIAHFSGFHPTLAMIIFKFMNMSFLYGIVALEHAHLVPLLFLFCLPLPLISSGSYLLGYRRISISHKIIYKKPNPNSKINKMRMR